jgi:transposase InsO family protein
MRHRQLFLAPHRPVDGPARGEAFPRETAPRSLRRDRGVYGPVLYPRVADLGMEQVLTAPQSPWQHPYAERLIGSIRRECRDRMIFFNENHLRRVLARSFRESRRWCTYLSLAMDAPDGRPVQPPDHGRIVAGPEVGGLRRHYERRAA